jgi:integrase
MLNDTLIRQAKPTATPYKLADGKGMFLLVSPTDDPAKGKRWRLKYRFDGKEKLLALGAYPEVGLKAARDLREAARALLASGVDPGEHRKEARRTAVAQRLNTFGAISEEWYSKKVQSWAKSSAKKVRTYLDLDLIPELGARPIAEIRRPELVALLKKIEGRGALDVAKKSRGWLAGVFHFAQASGIIEASPATDLHVVAAHAPARVHHPHLPIAKLPDFIKSLDAYISAPDSQAAIRLLMLTAVRPGELRGAVWDEFDLDAAIWSIPAERMKMRRPHVIPLPTQAVAILREIEQRRLGGPLVFASPYKPKQAISENTINVAIGRMGYKGKQTGHGFRHMISTALNERGYNSDWIERQLAHGDANEVRGIYNKASYLDQRRDMMQAWADQLDSMAKGQGNVAALRSAA